MIELAADQRVDFDRLKSQIERALFFAGGTHDLEDVWESIEGGKAQLWPGVMSVVVTEVVVAPKVTTLHWWLAGGNMNELKAMEPGIMAWGASRGCTRMTLAGRKGWERAWSTRDWTPILSVLERQI